MTQHSNINKNKCNRHYEFIYIKESEEKYGDVLIDFFPTLQRANSTRQLAAIVPFEFTKHINYKIRQRRGLSK